MRILFDHNVDRRFRKLLPGHDVVTTRERGWEKLANGTLMRSAAVDGFQAMITIDKKLEQGQNLRTLPLPIVVLNSKSNALPFLTPFAPFVLNLLSSPLDRLLYIVQADGTVLQLSAPRSVQAP